jgi:hypothetical protein
MQGCERVHPTMKPLQLVADAMQDCSNENDIILDLFGGSGSTMVAAHKTGRIAYLSELEPKYVNVIIRRMLSVDSSLKIICNEKDVTEKFRIKNTDDANFSYYYDFFTIDNWVRNFDIPNILPHLKIADEELKLFTAETYSKFLNLKNKILKKLKSLRKDYEKNK